MSSVPINYFLEIQMRFLLEFFVTGENLVLDGVPQKVNLRSEHV